MIVMIDAGNTAIKAILLHDDAVSSIASIVYASLDIGHKRDAGKRLVAACLKQGLPLDAIAFVSSLPQDQQLALADSLDAQLPQPMRRITKADCLPHLKAWHYDTHDLGLDRMMNLVATHTLYPDETVVIINAGTALCVDLLHKGEHIGGWIQPGFRAWCSLLQEKAPHLPAVNPDEMNTPETWPRSTKEALAFGLHNPYMLGVIHAVHFALNATPCTSPDKLILTGGDAETIAAAFKCSSTFKDVRVIKMLAVYANV